SIEAQIPDSADLHHAQAIVVLGGDVRIAKAADGGEQLGPLSLERVIYAAAAYRQLRKPIAVTGGTLRNTRRSVGALMKDMLETEFGIPVAWNEDRSKTTWENAAFTADVL